jgi:catechol 2,3-dioxygenase-like lactoylglutathione lyase family enzyme
MKRLHLHVSVEDLARSVRFYATLFGAEPSVLKPDYAKWMLDDPRVNFAISARPGRAAAAGLDHLGIQVETPEELREVRARLREADGPVLDEGRTTCCYARSDKAWISDPQGLAWEAFLAMGESTDYGDGADLGAIRTTAADGGPVPAPASAPAAGGGGCCGPKAAAR